MSVKKPIDTSEVRFDNPYMSDVSKVSWLQRAILIHSVLYYEYNNSIVPDEKYDVVCRQLANMQSKLTKQQMKQTDYGYAFYDFDGSTGYHLFSRLKRQDKVLIQTIASHAPIKSKSKRRKVKC